MISKSRDRSRLNVVSITYFLLAKNGFNYRDILFNYSTVNTLYESTVLTTD
jgi:hypothetical protein